jgi:predicted ribosome quality control (RQC) complex YloA/Tae2 family protein
MLDSKPVTLTSNVSRPAKLQRLDALSMQQLAREIHEDFVGAKIQKIHQYGPTEWALEWWGVRSETTPEHERCWLIIDLNKENPFLGFWTSAEFKSVYPSAKSTHQSPLLMSLRKYLQGSRLEAVQATVGESVLEFHVKYRCELGFQRAVVLIVELMGKYSNMLLLEGASRKILHLQHVVDDTQSRLRPLHVGGTYTPPPQPFGRVPWTTLNWQACWQNIATYPRYCPKTAFSALQGKSWGLSKAMMLPLLEAVASFEDAEALLKQWIHQPTAVVRYTPNGEPSGFHGLCLTETDVAMPSMLWATGVYFYAWKSAQVHEKSRHRLRQPLKERLKRLDKERQRLQLAEANALDLDAAQHKGDVLMTLYSMRFFKHPKPFETNFTPELNPLTGDAGPEMLVDLKKTWLENAQVYYRQVQKEKGRRAYDHDALHRLDAQASFFQELSVLLEHAETPDDLLALEEDWKATGLIKMKVSKTREKPSETTGLLKMLSPDGLTIWVGKSSQANGRLLAQYLKAKDWWLHVAEGLVGSHVVVKVQGTPWAEANDLPVETLKMATALAAWYSEGRHSGKVPVLYTRGKYVRTVPHSWPGHVTYSQESMVVVVPQCFESSQIL